MDRSKVSDKGFDAGSRLFLVPLKFGGLSTKKRRVHLPKEESWWEQYRSRKSEGEAAGVREVPSVQEAPRRVRDTGTRASAKRTLSRDVEAASEGTPQSVSFDTPFQTGEREVSFKMNFFIEQDENVMNPKRTIPGTDVCSEEEQKMAWMRETRIGIFMQMKLEACRNELDWLIRCHNCAAYNYPEEEYPPRPLLIFPITSKICTVD